MTNNSFDYELQEANYLEIERRRDREARFIPQENLKERPMKTKTSSRKTKARVYRFHDLVAFTLSNDGETANTIYLEVSFCKELCHSLMDVAADIKVISFSHSDLKTVELGGDDKGIRFVGLGEGGPEQNISEQITT